MARRQDHTRDELRQLAIDAGRQIVTERGPAALTARNVAQKIGYTAGTLYNLFENLDGLSAAINILSMRKFAATIRHILEKDGEAKVRLQKISQAYLDFHKNDPHLWSLLFAVEVDHQSEAYHQAIHEIFDQVTEAVRALSPDGQTARRKAKVLWSTLHGICLLEQSGKLNVSESDSAEELVDEFLHQFLSTSAPSS